MQQPLQYLKEKEKLNAVILLLILGFQYQHFLKIFQPQHFGGMCRPCQSVPPLLVLKVYSKCMSLFIGNVHPGSFCITLTGGGNKINIFLRIYLLPFKKLCMAVSSLKIIIIDGRCSISLRLLCKF